MFIIAYRLSLGKTLFIFVYLVNELISKSSLNLIIKRVKLKHNNVFVNTLMSIEHDLHIYIYIYIVLYIYMYTCIKIYKYILEIEFRSL